MRSSMRTYSAAFGLLASSMLIMAGCSSTTSAGTAAGASSAGPYAASAPATTALSSAATSVTAAETEFSITLSQTTFTPGAYTFKVSNQGKYPHNLTVKGPGVDTQASPTLQAGQNGTVTVTLQAGSYELWCSVPGHKDKGMDLTITVA